MGLRIITRLKLRTYQMTTHCPSFQGQFVLVWLDKREKYTIQAKRALLFICSNCIAYLCYPVSLADTFLPSYRVRHVYYEKVRQAAKPRAQAYCSRSKETTIERADITLELSILVPAEKKREMHIIFQFLAAADLLILS